MQLKNTPAKHNHKLIVKYVEFEDLPSTAIQKTPFVKVRVSGWQRAQESNTSEMTKAYKRDQNRLKDKLHVKVYDSDRLFKKNLLGVAEIPLTKCMLNEGQLFDEWFPLMKRNAFGGYQPTKSQIHLQFVYRIQENKRR